MINLSKSTPMMVQAVLAVIAIVLAVTLGILEQCQMIPKVEVRFSVLLLVLGLWCLESARLRRALAKRDASPTGRNN